MYTTFPFSMCDRSLEIWWYCMWESWGGEGERELSIMVYMTVNIDRLNRDTLKWKLCEANLGWVRNLVADMCIPQFSHVFYFRLWFVYRLYLWTLLINLGFLYDHLQLYFLTTVCSPSLSFCASSSYQNNVISDDDQCTIVPNPQS